MRINNNISAMNTYSRLTSANTAKSGSLAKLSSGFRINRAGDDAAGLAISEKMRGQIGGLKQSVRNAQDGISLIQTAEGALTETHSILGRMRDLAVQASSDTNTKEDRAEIQKEINELSEEISRIADNTEFNTKTLLNGGLSGEANALVFHIGANQGQNIKLNIGNMGAGALKVNVLAEGEEVADTKGSDAIIGKQASASAGSLTFTAKNSGDTLNGVEIEVVVDATATSVVVSGTAASGKIRITVSGAETSGDINTALTAAGITVTKGGAITAGTGKMTDGVTAKAAVLPEEATGIDLSTSVNADKSISIINDAIESVSAERSKLGATQNRLEHTINNLTATAENLSEAESRIRDVDMAEEMMEFTKNNILSQAATSMLAQANQMPQSVLQLLQ